MTIRSIALAWLAFAQAAFALPSEPEVTPDILHPSSNWYVDYGDDHCRLARRFGTGDRKSVFYLEQYEPGNLFSLLVAGPNLEPRPGQEFALHFGPNGAERTYSSLPAMQMSEFGEGAMVGEIPLLADGTPQPAPTDVPDWSLLRTPLDPERAKEIEWLDVRRGKGAPVWLALGQMGGPIEALNTCTGELLTHWGIDLAAHRNRASPSVPIGNPAGWISSDDYPSGLAAAGTQGMVFFRLLVDAEGRMTGCHNQQNTGSDKFEHTVCDLFARRARFKPALDREGQPMASYWRSSIRFVVGR